MVIKMLGLGLRTAAALGILAMASGARAQTQYYDFNSLGSTTASRTFTIGTWSVIFQPAGTTNVAGCYFDHGSAGTCTGGTGSPEVQVSAQIHRGTLTLEFYSHTTGAANGTINGDLVGSSTRHDNNGYFNFEVTTPTTNAAQKINSVSLAITSSAGGTSNNLTGYESVCTAGSTCQTTPPSWNITTTGGATTTPYTGFTAAKNISVSKDLLVAQSSPVNIHVMTEIFTSTPEPASLAVLGVGLFGLATTRRRLRTIKNEG